MNSQFHNWSDIRVFLAVMQEGSTLAAARRLGMSQPTVARRIDALEHAFGLTLFDRDTRGFKPTKEARALLPQADRVAAAAVDLADAVQALRCARPIRITAYSGNFSSRITAIVSEFTLQHPDVSFEFLPSVDVLDLAAGEADIALRLSRTAPDPKLICRSISTAHYTLYGARPYAEKHGLPVSPQDLRDHRFISFHRDGVSSALHDWLTRHVDPGQIRQVFTEIELMHAAIRSGFGLGIINVKYAESDDALIRCFDPLEELDADHLMLISPDAYRRPEVKAFTKFFAPRYAAIFR